jgi:uncharacterized protein DUF748
MPRKKKITIIAGVILILYSLIGFIAIPLILESILPDKLSEALNRPVSISNIRLNPFTLTAAVEGLNIKAKNTTDPFVSFDELFVNIQTMSLFKLGLVVKEIRLEKPNVSLARISETEFSFSDLIPEKESEPKPETADPEADKKPFHFSISNISVVDGNIAFWDELVQKKHTISPVNIRLPNISNFEKNIDAYSDPMFEGKFNKAGISLDIHTKPFHNTHETTVSLSLSGLEIPYYFTYVPENMVGFEITSGSLNVEARVSFLQTSDKPEVTVEGTIGLADLEMAEKNGSKFFALPGLQIDIAPSRPMEQQLTLASVKIESPELSVSRNPDGIINLTTFGPQPDGTTESPEANPEKKPEDVSTESAPEETDPKEPFQLDITEFLLSSGKILYTDAAANQSDAEPVKMSIDDLMIKLSGFSTTPDKTAEYNIQAKINKEAGISTAGQLGITPLFVESDFSLADLKLTWGQPYIPANVKLLIADGKFTTSGHVAVHTTPEGELKTTITGKAAINEFNSIDPAQKETFLSWTTFSFDGIDVATNPLTINTDKILLKDFKNQFIIFNDGASNINKIFVKSETKTDTGQKPSEPEAPENQKETETMPIKIGEVLLDNFDIKFIDQKIEPHFSTHLNLSELKVTGLTSEDFKSADLTGDGKIDEYAPISIKGAVNPLQKDLFLDLKCNLSNMELSPLSPYAGKYIGQAIAKGKLSTGIVYKIDKKEITAHNRVLLDQFTLGKTVQSQDAINLPVGLAISLLKDRNGEINIDLPISGRTDDPDFGLGKPLLKALTNLIVKASTSPFDLVSSIAGGGEELRFIEFDAAAASINDASSKKLNTVKKLMYERPTLKMDISGYVDMETDRDAIIAQMLTRKIKQRKLGKEAPEAMESLDKMVLNPEEYQKSLRQVYAETILSDPEKQKTAKTLKDPSLTIKEMESAIRSEISVTDAAMRLLALERAQQVKQNLLQDGSVTPERLFLTEPKTLSPDKKGEFKAARVELNVR